MNFQVKLNVHVCIFMMETCMNQPVLWSPRTWFIVDYEVTDPSHIKSSTVLHNATLPGLCSSVGVGLGRWEAGVPVEWQQAMHYSDIIMGATAAQITSLMCVYSTLYSGTDKKKHRSSASLAFVRGIHRWPVNSLHKWPVTRKMFPCDDVIMCAEEAGRIIDGLEYI